MSKNHWRAFLATLTLLLLSASLDAQVKQTAQEPTPNDMSRTNDRGTWIWYPGILKCGFTRRFRCVEKKEAS